MIRFSNHALGLALAGLMLWSAPAMAQTYGSGTQPSSPSATQPSSPSATQPSSGAANPSQLGDSKQVEGTIQSVKGDTVVLTDGTELTIPSSLSVQRDELQPGKSVKANYEEKGGQKVVTLINVTPNQ